MLIFHIKNTYQMYRRIYVSLLTCLCCVTSFSIFRVLVTPSCLRVLEYPSSVGAVRSGVSATVWQCHDVSLWRLFSLIVSLIHANTLWILILWRFNFLKCDGFVFRFSCCEVCVCFRPIDLTRTFCWITHYFSLRNVR